MPEHPLCTLSVPSAWLCATNVMLHAHPLKVFLHPAPTGGILHRPSSPQPSSTRRASMACWRSFSSTMTIPVRAVDRYDISIALYGAELPPASLPARPHTMPDASRGRGSKSSMIGTRKSSLFPRSTRSKSDLDMSRSSKSSDAASSDVRVRLRKRGWPTSHLVSPFCNPISSVRKLLGLSRRPAHWTRRISALTLGVISRHLRRAKVRACNSSTVAGGGVDGDMAAKEEVDDVLRV